jgi:hypothetical protein
MVDEFLLDEKVLLRVEAPRRAEFVSLKMATPFEKKLEG